MKLGAQLYTIRDFTKTEDGMYNSLKQLKNMGYDYVQLSGGGYNILPAELIKSYLDELGLKAFVTHNGFDRLTRKTDEVIAEHKMLGIEYVGIGAMPSEMRTDKEGYDAFLAGILPVSKKLADNGLKFVYHNHRFEFAKIDGEMTGMDYLTANTSPSEFGLLVDTYWIQNGGRNPAKFITENADRIEVVHFKDYGIFDDKEQMREIGKGNLEWDEIIPACKNVGVKWVAVEQDVCPSDPFDCLAVSYNFLKDKM